MRGFWARRRLMCPEVGRLLSRYLDGEIDELKAQRIARHLEDCRRCGMKAETYTAIKQSLRARGASIPPDTIDRLRAFGERLAAEGLDDEPAEGSSGT